MKKFVLALFAAAVLAVATVQPVAAQVPDGFVVFPGLPDLTFYCMSSTNTCYLWNVPVQGPDDPWMWVLNPYTWVLFFL